MRDSLDPSAAKPTKAVLCQNCYAPSTLPGSALVGRPGFQQAGSQLGASGKRTGQLVTQFTTSAGTEYTVAIVGGQGIYTFNWAAATRAWTQVVTVANLTTASITLSETATVYAVTFANTLLISDGVNKPFTWDGTSGAGGLVSLTNCPVLFGQPWVYYAKVNGIKNADRLSFVWSEENDPTLGYDTSPYSNVWTLGQTDQNALYAGIGTNSAEFYFRARSAGVISGAITPDFTSDGVHDGASSAVGTISPGAVVYHEGRIFFLDAELQPHVITPGTRGAVALWDDAIETVGGLDRAYASLAQGVYHPGLNLVLFAVPELSQTIPSMILAVNPFTAPPTFAAVFRGFTLQRMGIVKNLLGKPTLMHLDNAGYAYDHGLPGGALWDDGLNSGTVAIRHIVTSPAMGQSVADDKRFDRLDINFRAPSSMTGILVRTKTPRGVSTTQTFSITSSLARWDVAVWDTDTWSANSIELHQAIGMNQFGRWVEVSVQHEATGEQFGLERLQVSAVPYGDAPEVP